MSLCRYCISKWNLTLHNFRNYNCSTNISNILLSFWIFISTQRLFSCFLQIELSRNVELSRIYLKCSMKKARINYAWGSWEKRIIDGSKNLSLNFLYHLAHSKRTNGICMKLFTNASMNACAVEIKRYLISTKCGDSKVLSIMFGTNLTSNYELMVFSFVFNLLLLPSHDIV